MRILVENGEYWLRNRGDIAMLSVTVARLRARWPHARIGVLTDQPRVLRALLPEAEPIGAATGGDWPAVPGGHPVADRAALLWRAWTDGPKTRLRAVRNRLRPPATESGEPAQPAVPAAAATASLVVAQGGGYMTDVDRYQAHRALSLLEFAGRRGIATAMTGQGFGPLTSPDLVARAAAVLPGVGFIGLREGRRGPALLDAAGVDAANVLVTGDDAIEAAYDVRRPGPGTDLGICLRVADYAPVSDGAREVLGAVVREQAAVAGAALTPLIISEYDSEDRRCTLPLLAGARRTRRPVARAGTAADVARQVGGCRVIVTSAYHLAVFALSQGVPAIGITASEYYDDKFYGLAEMFGTPDAPGLRIVHLDDPNLRDSLTAAVVELWAGADDLREPLQAAALRQIEASRAGFDRVFGLVDGDSAGVGARHGE
ncbi:polysaccharide pyruvyl transferase family protein [Nocardia stercoris]|uniref:Polysaccharide pyruvyl transferase family protein n=1 Tax=Nocardia stercoris TaxID=2483361 RepID=A0A3M2L3V9_9NOCA|nr:polysaccharide pyruvyl transferase family protein [Nocardia stercoris]RMI32392.1 polysaccharide pyruvyl transferase family protein [Nocardia stercoris]